MAKPVPAEGPWRSFSVSLRESDLARLDEVRGSVNRSEWARAVLLHALGQEHPPIVLNMTDPGPVPPYEAQRIPKRIEPEPVNLANDLRESLRAASETAAPSDCKHPGVGKKQRCPKCGRYNT